jgi:hypothetical protein
LWNTIYESPGSHALQAGLLLEHAPQGSLDQDINGPVTTFVVSNLCQFSVGSAYFKPEFGATLRARLPEANGRYRAEMKLPSGEVLKTLSGSTSNGVIKVYWDLIDEHGKLCTNQSYESLFHIILPDSGRSQTLKGP